MPLVIGDKTYGSPIVRGPHNTITIGKYCSIGESCIFDGGFHHNYKFVTTYPIDVNMFMPEMPPNRPPVKDISVGNDVWFGESCVIMNGVTIGDGAVIGINSIITKDVAPYSIVVGANRVVGKRFNDEQINKLLNIQWWDWPDERVRQNAHLLLSEDIDNFIKNHI